MARIVSIGSKIEDWVKKKKKKGKPIKKQLDDLWRDIVKQRAGFVCEYESCNKKTYLNSHHIFRKRNMATRWDLDNGLCLCSGHHTLNNFSAHHSPEFTDWIKKYLGEEKYNRIRDKSYTIKKWSISELEELLEKFKKELYLCKQKKLKEKEG